jgi:hypothetical protein
VLCVMVRMRGFALGGARERVGVDLALDVLAS